jgi:predicted MPP superfamily phosphohydrolase
MRQLPWNFQSSGGTGEDHLGVARSSPVQTVVRRWLFVLNAAVVLAGLGLGAAGERRGFFLAALVPLALAPFSYGRWRVHRTLARSLGDVAGDGWQERLFAVGGIACDLILITQLVTARTPGGVPMLHGPGIAWIGPVWFSVHALVLPGYGVVGLGRTLRRALRSFQGRVRRERAAPARSAAQVPASLDRREFLQRMGVAGVAIPFAASASGVSISYDFRVEEREVVVPGWPRVLDGLRVVHLSDIHVGAGMTRERLLRVAELTNGCRPDLVAHTGDFLTHRSGDFDAPLYEALARIRAPFGQWACLGNHDYDDPERLVRRLEDAGVVVLRDRLTRVRMAGDTLEIGGAEFVFGAASRAAVYARVIAGWGPRDGMPRLLLNHDPSAFAALPSDAANLTLSGHTHGGHVGLQLGRSRALTVVGLLGLPDQGLFTRGDMRLFVTRCVGFYGYPMRVGIPPEIAVLVLRTPGSSSDPTPARAL